jgi:hypothetical protein
LHLKLAVKSFFATVIAIIHYFWKTKVLNLKNFASFWPIFLHDTHYRYIEKLEFHILFFVSIARQPDKRMLQISCPQVEVSFEGTCGRIARYPLANIRAHLGALPVNKLNNNITVVWSVRLVIQFQSSKYFFIFWGWRLWFLNIWRSFFYKYYL